jgi:hypothetical protein
MLCIAACPRRFKALSNWRWRKGEQAQHAVIQGQLTVALDLAQQAAAVTARGLQRATGNRAGNRGSAEGQAADQQVDTGTGSGTCGDPATDAHAKLFEGFGVEQVIAPAAVEQWQVAGGGVLRAEAEQFEQGLHTLLFALAHSFA